MMPRRLWSLLLLVPVAHFGCNRTNQKADEAPPKPEVKVSEPVREYIVNYEVFTGRTQSVNRVDLKTRVTGYLEKLYVGRDADIEDGKKVIKEGDDVKKGDVLFVLQQKPFEDAVAQARGNLEQLRLQVSFNKRDYQRFSESKSGASPADLDRALTAVTTTEASVKTAEAALSRAQQDLEWATIRAPFDGRIGKRQVDRGNDVKADETILASIEQIDPLYAYFDVDERTLLRIGGLLPNGKVPADAATKFPLTAGLANEKPEDFSHHGTLQFADNKVDPSTGTLRMYGLFENPKGDLKSGMFVRVRMGVGAAQPSYFVAESALSSDQGRRYVYLLDDENKVLYVEVTVGQRKDGLIAVEGKDRKLKGNEKIIVDGLQRVKPKMEVNPTVVEMPRSGASQPTGAKVQESGEKKADSGK
jgi:RND family efflux transporter MFP subunit